jgi:hypothetical protein
VKNLSHNASFESFDKDAPSKPGAKQLGWRTTDSAPGNGSSWPFRISVSGRRICSATLPGSQRRRPKSASCRASLVFLPKYSPDLNPIGQVFAKFKTLLRKAEARSYEAISGACGEILAQYPPAECAAYLKNAGYAQSQNGYSSPERMNVGRHSTQLKSMEPPSGQSGPSTARPDRKGLPHLALAHRRDSIAIARERSIQ